MKRVILLFATIIVAAAAKAKVSWGLRAGLGVNKVSAMELPVGKLSLGNIVGPTVGAMGSVRTCKWLDVQMELNYAMRGYKSEVLIQELNMAEGSYRVRSSYLEVPLFLKVYPIKSLPLNIQVGPQVGVLLGRKVSTNWKQIDTSLVTGEDRKVDAAMVFGLGYEAGNWCFDARYTLGLLETYTDWKGYRNRGFSLSAGYFF